MSKSVLISIRPKWCEKILNGEKTIEVRKTKPKLTTPFKCYIYCSLPPKDEMFTYGSFCEYARELIRDQDGNIKYTYGMSLICDEQHRPYSKDNFLCRKVIGEFICDKMYLIAYTICPHDPPVFEEYGTLNRPDVRRQTCLNPLELDEYLSGNNGYGWHISKLKIYDKPKELSEFTRLRDTKFGATPEEIKRPPQSWYYVEEQ